MSTMKSGLFLLSLPFISHFASAANSPVGNTNGINLATFTDVANTTTNWPACHGVGVQDCGSTEWCSKLTAPNNAKPKLYSMSKYFDVTGKYIKVNGKDSPPDWSKNAPAKKRRSREAMRGKMNEAREKAELEKRINADDPQLCIQPLACGTLNGTFGGTAGGQVTNFMARPGGGEFDLLADYPGEEDSGGAYVVIAQFQNAKTNGGQAYYFRLATLDTLSGGLLGRYNTPNGDDFQGIYYVFIGDPAKSPQVARMNWYDFNHGDLPGDAKWQNPQAQTAQPTATS